MTVAAVVLVAEQAVARPAGMAEGEEVVSAEAGEDIGLGLLGQRASAGCRECVRACPSAPDWQTEGGRRSGGRGQGQKHLRGR